MKNVLRCVSVVYVLFLLRLAEISVMSSANNHYNEAVRMTSVIAETDGEIVAVMSSFGFEVSAMEMNEPSNVEKVKALIIFKFRSL